MNQELRGYLLGNANSNVWFAVLIAAGFTGLIMNMYRISKRDKDSSRTPTKFNIWFFFKDTGFRLLYTMGFLLILLRFMFIFKIETGWAVGLSILLGVLSDRLGKILTRAGDKGEQLINDKMDEIADKLRTTEAKVDVTAKKVDVTAEKIDSVQTDVTDIKNEVTKND